MEKKVFTSAVGGGIRSLDDAKDSVDSRTNEIALKHRQSTNPKLSITIIKRFGNKYIYND